MTMRMWCRSGGRDRMRSPWSGGIVRAGLVALATLGACLSPAGASDALKDELKSYLQSGDPGACLRSYHGLNDRLGTASPSAAELDRDPWLWPGWFYCAAVCSPRANDDAPRAEEAARSLLSGGQTSAAILTGIFGAHCFMHRESYRNAYPLLSWLQGEEKSARPDKWSVELWPLARQYSWYVSSLGLIDRVRSAATRPGIVVAAFNLSENQDFSRDRDAASAAIAWLILESLNRIIADHPLEDGVRALTVNEDLALRFDGGRIAGVNSQFDLPVESDDLNFSYPSYMKQIHDYGKAFIGGYLSVDARTRLVYNNLDPAATWERGEVERPFLRTGQKEFKYADMGGLALDAALDILSHFQVAPGETSIPPPGGGRPEWKVLPSGNLGEERFLLFVEAVGCETRGNVHRAADRYAEIVAARPANAIPSEWSFLETRLQRCRDLSAFDTPDRFMKTNAAVFRQVLLKLVG